ncbi:MAG TPA: adenylate/guanylate cyclase domain-containing protein [Terriglobales bacterium]|nr:adenylate/guanylate cyclase domain-containing protein [Terriglobales bacterium]
MFARLHPTLRQLFALSLLGLTLSLALLFYLFARGSQRTILQTSQRFRDSASSEVATRVTDYLNQAPLAVTHFEEQVKYGLVNPQDSNSIESGLLSLLLANDNISEATFTYGRSAGFDEDGNIRLKPMSAGQVTVWRSDDGALVARHVWFDGKHFLSESHSLNHAARRPDSRSGKVVVAMDPTDHLTFRTPSDRNNYGTLLWTDLHWSQLNEFLSERRVEVSTLKTIDDSSSEFAGVLRIGLMKKQIDLATQVHLAASGANDPHRVFLCDRRGRLITGFGAQDRVVESEDEVRIAAANLPPPVVAALQQPWLKTVDAEHPVAAGSFRLGSITYLCTFRALPGTQDWIAGIVVPQNYYLESLLRTQRRVFWAAVGLMLAILVTGGFILHGIGRAHSMVVRETVRMKAFDFMPSANSSRLRDVEDVLEGFEKAKTAMRAMSKYVPIDLVRRLYHEGREPSLGAEPVELSLLFTDIKEFTTIAEQISPDRLAEILGRYLQVVTGIIHKEKGTVDKYIGDAVMAFWNAPEPLRSHAVFACRAALGCQESLGQLYASPQWSGCPVFETRFGLHACVASVGHFGAPDRFNYTAIGDGVNLTSRLEGLNKHYGTSILASEAIYRLCCEEFEFRLLDRVAVKGKTQGVTIYELLGVRSSDGKRKPHIISYEQAFAAYLRSDFRGALHILTMQAEIAGAKDAPGAVLAERCRYYLEHPPAGDWTGVHSFTTK